MQSSNSVENYIKGIHSLSSSEKDWVSTNVLAEKMNIRPSSVTDMIKRLRSKKLVSYQKYKGVKLTSHGEELALKVIRKHRLWEVFLHNKLGFNWDEVHDIAEQLEHIASSELVERLDAYLEFPKYDPHGDPIPDSKGKMKDSSRELLSNLKVGDSGQLVGVEDSSSSFLQFLESKKLNLGCTISVIEIFEYDESMEIKLMGIEKSMNVSRDVCHNLYMIKQ